MFRLVVVTLSLGTATASLKAQVVLQQPVVSVTGVQTVVSVPDGGRAHLGRIDRAKDSRGTYGFTPFGSSLGREVSRSGMDVGVTIHDFEAMDQWLLSQPRDEGYQFRQTSVSNIWGQLGGDVSRVQASIPPSDRSTATTVPTKPRVASGTVPLDENNPADRLVILGDAALGRGDQLGALRYYQSARRLGSTIAGQRIQTVLAN